MARQYSGLTKLKVACAPYGVTTVDFFDVKPNYYQVSNFGGGKIYCSTSSTPTDKDYEFSVKADGVKMFAEPFRRSCIYIYNPTGETINAGIICFYAEFDPLALAFANLEIDFTNMNLETTTSIDSFKAALPAGENKIGKVDVAAINAALPAGNNKIGKVDVANAKDYTTPIANIKNSLDSLLSANDPETTNNLQSLMVKMQKISRKFLLSKSGTATSAGTTYSAPSNAEICDISFFSNDGDSNLTLTFTESDNTVNTLVVKKGEVINNTPCALASIKISGSAAYRLVYNERVF